MRQQLREVLTGVRGDISWDEPLAPHTSFRVGGPADAYVSPCNVEDVRHIFQSLCRHRIPYLVFGDGSNLLIPDEGFRGVILNLASLDQLRLLQKDDAGVTVFVGSGLRKQRLLSWAVERGYSGVEFLGGIPGQVGGGLFMNAGTLYGSFSDVVQTVYQVNASGEEEVVNISAGHFSYRAQTFCRDKILTGAILRLGYGDSRLMEERVKALIADRKHKQPLQYPNCGSTFMNPEHAMTAGQLIESAGLKGCRVGNAMISDKHANFIINVGQATSRDIMALIEMAEKKVLEVHGISLKREVIVVRH